MKILVNPYFSADKSFKDHDADYRVEDIDGLGSNVVQVFVANYLNYILSENIFDFNFIKREEHMLKELLAGNSGKGLLRFQEYAQWELAQDHDIFDDKINMYRRFLEKNDSYFHSLDILSSDFKLSPPELNFILAGLYDTKVSVSVFVDEINKFTDFLILFTRFSLLNAMTYSDNINFQTKKAQILNFYLLKNELKQEKRENQNYIIETFRETILSIEKEFRIKVIINEKLKIFNFIHDEINVLETDLGTYKSGRDDAQKRKMTSVIKDLAIQKLEREVDYPKHVFRDEKAFTLFHTIAKEMTKPAQLSFLFRQMSEAEKPAMIICRDAVFREWFNTEGYSLELENVTKRLSDVSTIDRLTLYNLAKKLLNLKN
ncbi:hypothetical protein LB452_02090 [Psychroflexus sp. CAK8W]|uniref:Uncharacterized protein n=1 Tax=Psychroflexus longus TaxID=2873596 RepID=A0ABS7XFF7_9FLAO|nr:hypothetical protein [Psychroflexus longus]MBZ9777701.1 hypothetical protein [Psychroflexus longus]